MSDRRLFNEREKQTLYVLAGGRCARCGASLDLVGWDADHVVPHSRGGQTHISNGQALCTSCNLKKGATMETHHRLAPWTIPLRDWQQQLKRMYFAAMKQDFLAVASPGSGKTIATLSVAHDMLRRGDVESVIVVTPTDHIRKQWLWAAHNVGIELNPQPIQQRAMKDFHGLVATYHQVMSAPLVYRFHAGNALIVLDEGHHIGDDLSWGRSVLAAFGESPYRLMVSGTPFRSDNNPIPFVTYEDNRSVADFVYGYGRALQDGVCRHIIFPAYDGEMEWMNANAVMRANFADQLADNQSRQRLNTALSARGQWLPKVLKEAHDKLMGIRCHPDPACRQSDAGGLVIAKDTKHARQVADLLEGITGERPYLVFSDNPQASIDITAFAKGSAPWIVAVKMISEGVDIPRLRVGVYATNVATPMAVLQAIGRFIRVQDMPGLEDQTAWLFVPHAPEFIPIITTITDERDHYLTLSDDAEVSLERTQRSLAEDNGRFWEIGSSAAVHVRSYFHDMGFTPEDIVEAQLMGEKYGMGIQPGEKLAAFILEARGGRPGAILSASPRETRPASNGSIPVAEQKTAYCRKINNLVNALAYRIGVPAKEIHTSWLRRGGKSHGDSSEDDLREKLQWVQQLLDETKSGSSHEQ